MELKPKTFSDTEVIANLRGNLALEPTLGFLYSAHFDTLCHHILSNSGSEADAEDIFQEVILAFVQIVQAGKFRGESSIRTFLFALNRNLWLNELKKRGRATTRELRYETARDASEGAASEAIEYRQASEELLGMVSKLGENCRKILLLYYFENRSMREILEQLDYGNEQVVRNTKYKCLKKLEKLVDEQPAIFNRLKSYFYG